MVLSIVIPVFNSDKYLYDCVKTIAKQCNDSVEIILIDDGSTDESPQICDLLSKEFSNVVTVHKKNGGVSWARNDGMKIAKGEYITFVDSDDLVSDSYITDILYIIKRYGCDCVCFNYIKSFGKRAETTKPLTLNEGYYSINDINDNYFLLRLIGPYFEYELKHIEHLDSFSICWNKVYKRDVIGSLLFQDISKFGTSEDLIFNCYFFKKCHSVFYVDKPLYIYRKYNSGSITSTAKDDLWKKWLNLYDELSNFSLLDERFQKAFTNRVSYGLLSLFLSTSSNISVKKLKIIIKTAMQESLYSNSVASLNIKPLPAKYRLFFYALIHKMYGLAALIIACGKRKRAKRLPKMINC